MFLLGQRSELPKPNWLLECGENLQKRAVTCDSQIARSPLAAKPFPDESPYHCNMDRKILTTAYKTVIQQLRSACLRSGQGNQGLDSGLEGFGTVDGYTF